MHAISASYEIGEYKCKKILGSGVSSDVHLA